MQVLKTTKQDLDSLTQRVYKDLRTAIITGNIARGTRLVESTLAADMQVSRTPVREALHKLAKKDIKDLLAHQRQEAFMSQDLGVSGSRKGGMNRYIFSSDLSTQHHK